jgi:hypothetical protein
LKFVDFRWKWILFQNSCWKRELHKKVQSINLKIDNNKRLTQSI